MIKSSFKLFQKKNLGFTLVELLVVMSIIGVLASIISSGFRTAQMRGRDAKRKSDLKELAVSLELFFADYNQYPPESSGLIAGCPYLPGAGTPCTWGDDELTDNKTVYFKTLPIDVESSFNYVYKIVLGSNNQKFQLFARLENPLDKSCLGGNCGEPPVSVSCGAQICNFSVTSSNTSPTE